MPTGKAASAEHGKACSEGSSRQAGAAAAAEEVGREKDGQDRAAGVQGHQTVRPRSRPAVAALPGGAQDRCIAACLQLPGCLEPAMHVKAFNLLPCCWCEWGPFVIQA